VSLASLAYDLDASLPARLLPSALRVERASPAWRDVGGRWLRSEPHEPRLEAWGLRLEGARVNLLPLGVQGPASDWAGAQHFAYLGRQSAVDTGLPAQEHRALMDVAAPFRTLPAPGFGALPHSLSAIVERLDATGAALAVLGTSGTRRRVLVGDAGTSVGSGWSRVADRGVGLNGGPLAELALGVARAAGDTLAVYPVGLAEATTATILHHLQYERGAFASSPVATLGVDAGRSEERCHAALGASAAHAGAVQLLLRAAPGTEHDQVAWQIDDGTEAERVALLRDKDAALRLELVRGGVATASVALGVLPDGTTCAVALRVTDSTLAACRDGGALATASHGGAPVCSAERWGGSSVVGRAWYGWLVRARRWASPAADDDLPPLAAWQSPLPQAA
jgi:hypothetical protein